MSLSLAEIKIRAIDFSVEWANETSEDAEAKSFWDAFFNIFGISRRRVAAINFIYFTHELQIFPTFRHRLIIKR